MMRKKNVVRMTLIFILSLIFIINIANTQAQAATITEWDVQPICDAWGPFQIAAYNGIVFFTAGNNIIGQIDTSTNIITKWSVEFTQTSPGDIIVQELNGKLYVLYTDSPNRIIKRLDPEARRHSGWGLPGFPSIRDFALGPENTIWFSSWSTTDGGKIGALKDNVVFSWQLPEIAARIADVVTDSLGRVFYTTRGDNYVGMLEPDTGDITLWPLPASPNFGIETDASGNVFFLEVGPGIRRLARINPDTNTLTEWDFSGSIVSEFITVDPSGKVYFTAFPYQIAMLDPSVPGIDVDLTPENDTATREKGTVMNLIVSLAGKIDIPTVPSVNTIVGIPFDLAFTEWSGLTRSPRGIMSDQQGRVFVTEQSSYMIGMLAFPSYTPPGDDVIVEPVDPDPEVGDGTEVTVTFPTVTGGGETTVTSSGTGTPPPEGFKLGNPPVYYSIETTAEYEPPVQICIDYSGISYGNENNLRLFHQTDSGWEDVTDTGYPDTKNKIICGTVDSLSEFAMMEPAIIIDGCNTGVGDVEYDGKLISVCINECGENAKNHGKFLSCVAGLTNELEKAGVITGEEKGAIQSCAAQADIP